MVKRLYRVTAGLGIRGLATANRLHSAKGYKRQLDQGRIEAIARRLEAMRATLVARARDAAWPMNPLDRREIVGYLDKGVVPEPPRTVPDLMKNFLKSCYTYSVLRSFSTSLLGKIPTPPTMG